MRNNEREYLQTKEWQEKRLARLKMDDFKCCRCGNPHNVQVHHTDYKNLGNEDVANDLATLCDSCHESLNNATIAGCKYKQPTTLSSNFGIKETILLPDSNYIIFIDMGEIDPEMQIQLKGGKIRLCEVRFAGSDYYKNEKYYSEDIKSGIVTGTYDEYQWKNDSAWLIFVELDNWYHEVPSNVIFESEIRKLQNGVSVLYGHQHAEWESYKSVTKDTINKTVTLLDELEQNYKEIAHA